MWLQFALVVVFLSALLLLPGFLFITALTKNATTSALVVAPAISVAFYTIAGLVVGALGTLGLPASLAVCLLPLLAPLICILVQTVRLKAKIESSLSFLEMTYPCLYVVVSTVVIGTFFIMNLDGPDAIYQQSDNISHLGKILEMAHDGNYSVLRTTSYYLADIASGSSPIDWVGSYPNGFLIPTALAVALLGVSAPLAENAALFVFSAIVYPLASYSLIRRLFGRKLEVASGAIATAAFAAFPLGLFVFGPIYPVMAGFCCVPAIISLFIGIFDKERRGLLQQVILFVFCCIGAAALQPSAVLTAGVMLIPFCIHVFLQPNRYGLPDIVGRHRIAFVSLFLLLVLGLWLFLTYGPIMRSVTSFSWAALDNSISGIYNVLTLALRLRAPQYTLAFLVALGLISLVSRRNVRWVVASYLLVCALYFVGNAFDSWLKQLFTGFWYTDQWRTAANIAIIGVPVAAAGIAQLISLLVRSHDDCARVQPLSAGALCALLCLLIFQPQQYLIPNGPDSAFGSINNTLEEAYTLGSVGNSENIYTYEERDFAQEAASTIPEGSIVLNMPSDGSIFAYLSGTLNTYYKSYPSSDTTSSELIRTKLSELDHNTEVQEAVLSSGATYILLLEKNGFDDQGDQQWSLCGPYRKSNWTGFSTELDQLNSLELVLSEGNMRLYRIRTELF